ncbi:MAG: hypothetical protein OXD31_14730, partial [Chloroflexi bacterium]|nr:hypothetical protein [Chloroflexota bacterium]
ARGDELQQLTPFVQGGDAGRPGPGQRAGPVHHPLQHGVGFQVLCDAQAGLAQAGEASPQGLISL